MVFLTKKKIIIILSITIVFALLSTFVLISWSEIESFFAGGTNAPFNWLQINEQSEGPIDTSGSEIEDTEEPVEPEVIEAPALSEMEVNIAYYESLVHSEGTLENHSFLASLYDEAGEVKKQRDLLELSYQIYEDADIFNQLQ